MVHEMKGPQGASDSGPSTRVFTVIADAETLEGLRKRATTSLAGGFTFYADEPTEAGGRNTAPGPMVYFAAAIIL